MFLLRLRAIRRYVFPLIPMDWLNLINIQVKIWKDLDGRWTPVMVIKTADAATAVAFSPTDFDQRHALDGKVFITLWLAC